MVHAELTVAAIVCRNSRYLMVEETIGGRPVINQPAGHVEPGETIVEAAVRETREESAWRFRPTGFVGIYHWPHADGRTTLRIALAGDVDDHDPDQPLDAGIIAAHWLPAETLSQREDLRSALVMQSIIDYQSSEVLPLERVRYMRAAA